MVSKEYLAKFNMYFKKFKNLLLYCLNTKRRWILAIFLMLGNFCISFMRTQIGISMVCMVNTTTVYEKINTFNPYENITNETTTVVILKKPEYGCQKIISSFNESNIINAPSYQGTFIWTHDQQTLILSASFYGNLITMFFTGFLINKFGPKNIAFIGMSGMALSMAISPISAYANFYAFLIARFFLGVFENPVYPALSAILSTWFPSTEKSTAAAVFTSGSQISSSFGVILATTLCSLNFLNGWPLIFYFIAILSIFWIIIWFFYVTNTPENSKFLSSAEKEYLNEKNGNFTHKFKKKKPSFCDLPLRQMIFCKATVAIVVTCFGHKLTQTFMQIFLPFYSRDVLSLDLQANGLYSSLPFLFNFISKYFFSIFSDILKRREILSSTASCILFQSISSYSVATILLFMAFYIDCTKQLQALIMLIFYGTFMGASVPGFTTSSFLIAPIYTGMIFTFTMIAVTFGNLITPKLVDIFITKGSQNEWRNLFCVIAAINCLSGTVFLFWGSGEIQSWAMPQNNLNGKESVTNEVTKSATKNNTKIKENVVELPQYKNK